MAAEKPQWDVWNRWHAEKKPQRQTATRIEGELEQEELEEVEALVDRLLLQDGLMFATMRVVDGLPQQQIKEAVDREVKEFLVPIMDEFAGDISEDQLADIKRGVARKILAAVADRLNRSILSMIR